MRTYENGLSKEFCNELMYWGMSYVFARGDIHPLGFPNPVVTKTNRSWQPHIIKDSKPVFIYELHDDLKEKLKVELTSLGIFNPDTMSHLSAMVYIWTPGSYIPLHEDGFAETDRQVMTAYLNETWGVEKGGLFLYLDKNDDSWKVLIPHQGFLVYNDKNELHCTTPVNEGDLRGSLQIFIFNKKNA